MPQFVVNLPHGEAVREKYKQEAIALERQRLEAEALKAASVPSKDALDAALQKAEAAYEKARQETLALQGRAYDLQSKSFQVAGDLEKKRLVALESVAMGQPETVTVPLFNEARKLAAVRNDLAAAHSYVTVFAQGTAEIDERVAEIAMLTAKRDVLTATATNLRLENEQAVAAAVKDGGSYVYGPQSKSTQMLERANQVTQEIVRLSEELMKRRVEIDAQKDAAYPTLFRG
jgi:hypothetical protein